MKNIYIIMGVSGCGKTTVGKLLAQELNLSFHDADDYHPTANVEKMASGQPLNDDDRQPWLEILADKLAEWQQAGGAVLACSALKEKYRQTLQSQVTDIQWVWLDGSFELIQKRMQARRGHFMDAKMLQSQFDALEPPTYGLKISIDQSAEAIVEYILKCT
ncbi:MAG: gluconokinase [Saprospiraceae bacterium]